MNDREREEWVNNDEPLYMWWVQSKLSMRAFIKKYRNQLTDYINAKIGR